MTNNDRPTIEDRWQNLIKSVFKGQRVSDIQYQEMRRSFYCGFAAGLNLLSDIAADADITEEESIDYVAGLRTQIRDFLMQILEGGA